MATLRAGALLARRYRLIDPIGAGGMSIIWRARDELLDRMVAIKVLASELAADARFRALVREEARAAAQLVHPHVTAVHDYGELVGDDDSITAFVVMELLAGEELEARLTAGPLPWRTAIEVCAQVAEALSAAHRLGIVHRDVTPANIMLTANGAKVLDFGIATQIGAPDEDEDGDTFGTPAYVAPERLDGVPAQPATDTYSLGVLLFETLSGHVPFPAETWDDLARVQPGGPMPPLVVQGLPDGVVDVCRRCLSRDPRQRPTALQVGETLRGQLVQGAHGTAPRPPALAFPTVLPAPLHSAEPGVPGVPGMPSLLGVPGALATTAGGTATLVAGTGPPTDPAWPGGLVWPTDPGWITDPGRTTDPGRHTDPGHHTPGQPAGWPGDAQPPRSGWSPWRASLVAAGSIAALATALLVGLNLGRANDRTAFPHDAPAQVMPTGGASATAAPTPGTGGTPPVSVATPPATESRAAALTVDQAIAALVDTIDAGLSTGDIRRDAGLDLQQMINSFQREPTQLDALVATLRQKVAARANEGAIRPRSAARLNTALDNLIAAR